MDRGEFGAADRLPERVVLLFVHRAVEVRGVVGRVGFQPFSTAARPEHFGIIDGAGIDDRRDGVVEIQIVASRQLSDLRRERIGGERAARDDHRAAVGDVDGFVAHKRDAGMGRKPLGDERGERFSVHGQGLPGRNGGGVGAGDDQRAEPAHLGFEQAAGVRDVVGFERVRADDLGGVGASVRRGHLHRAHLDQPDLRTALRRLPRRLAARQSRPDHRHVEDHALSLPRP